MSTLNKLKVVSLLLCIVLLAGCSGKKQAAADDEDHDLFLEYNDWSYPKRIETLAMGEVAEYRYVGKPSKRRNGVRRGRSRDLEGGSVGSRRQLLRAAHSALGTPYVVGGTSPGGFDCSGLVCWAYGNVGVKLPRTAREQSVVGTQIRNVEDMQAGDIVAFRHPKRGYHTGIYVGDGKFIHSPRRKSHVKINSLDDPYFSSTFLSARRINLTGRENLLAQAESRLRDEFSVSPAQYRLRLQREDSRFSRNASRERSAQKRKSMAEYREKRKNMRAQDKFEKRRRHEVADSERRGRSVRSEKSKSRRERNREVAERRGDSRKKSQVKNERSSRRKQETAYESRRSEKRTSKADSKRHSSRTRKS